MTQLSNRKRTIRTRMAETGEPYSKARRGVLENQGSKDRLADFEVAEKCRRWLRQFDNNGKGFDNNGKGHVRLVFESGNEVIDTLDEAAGILGTAPGNEDGRLYGGLDALIDKLNAIYTSQTEINPLAKEMDLKREVIEALLGLLKMGDNRSGGMFPVSIKLRIQDLLARLGVAEVWIDLAQAAGFQVGTGKQYPLGPLLIALELEPGNQNSFRSVLGAAERLKGLIAKEARLDTSEAPVILIKEAPNDFVEAVMDILERRGIRSKML